MRAHRHENPAHIIGLGLDNRDGHVRISQGENFHVFSGAAETHERMTAACLKLNERLARQGRKLGELSHAEFVALLTEVG